MNEKQERILRIVRKLFDLSNGAGTQEEAQSAAMKARALLSEYSLSMSDVELQAAVEELSCGERQQPLTTPHVPSWVKILFGGVRRGFGVEGIFTWLGEKRAVTFVGVEPDLSLASYTFGFLYRVGKRAPGMQKKRERQKNQWRMGFAYALLSRFNEYQHHEQSGQEMALMPMKYDLARDYIADRYPDLVKSVPVKKVRPTKAYQAGYTEGRRVQWGQPVGGGGDAAPMLEGGSHAQG
ncbi:MAG: DUF2786 domain-containing protein [Desulfovibrio sp.]